MNLALLEDGLNDEIDICPSYVRASEAEAFAEHDDLSFKLGVSVSL